jgi:glucosamine 6-phosphate synthetase-like amidotransferase/phosphosugar isomerase protein
MKENSSQPDYMLSEILEQTKIVNTIINDSSIREIARSLVEQNINHIYLTGSGDSYCAAWFGSYLANKWLSSLDAEHYAPFEFVNYFKPKKMDNVALIGLSVSGNTPRVVEAIRYGQKKEMITIGITDNPSGKLAKETDHTLFIHSSPPEELLSTSYTKKGAKEYTGYHHDIAQTKTYLANLATLSTLIAHMTEKDRDEINKVQEVFHLIGETINHRDKFLNVGQKIRKPFDKIFFIASGSNNPTALFGAYKMFEFTLNGFACDFEEYCHTGYFITTDRTLVIFLAPDIPSIDRLTEIEPVIREEIKAQTIILSNKRLIQEMGSLYISLTLPQDTILSPLVFTVPIEFLSYIIAKKHGFDTNCFRGGIETEKYVSGSYKTIRKSKLQY